jgi:hypothetical protein
MERRLRQEIHFSATHAERVSAPVVIDGRAYHVTEPDYPWSYPRDSLDQIAQSLRADWSTARDLETSAPHLIADQRPQRWARQIAPLTSYADCVWAQPVSLHR